MSELDVQKGWGCFLIALGIGLAIAIVILANAIAGGAIPPPW